MTHPPPRVALSPRWRTAAIAAWALLVLAPACDRRPLPGQAVSSAPSERSEAGGLRFIERVTGGAQASDRLPMIVAIHGRGGSPEHFGRALAGFSARARVILPYAPDPYGGGFTWFPDWDDDAHLAAGTRNAADRLAAMIAELIARRPTVGKPIVTGFSQGGMLSFTLAVLHPDVVGAAFPVGGFLAPPLIPSVWPESAPHPRIHAFHGTADEMVPIQLARDTVKGLTSAGLAAELTEYPGVPHAIPPPELQALIEAIEAALRSP